MKIVLYYKKLNMGGAERSTIRLLDEFVKAGHDVTLFLEIKGGKLESELNPSIQVKYIYDNKKDIRKPTGVKDINSFWRLFDLFYLFFKYCEGLCRKIKYRFDKTHYNLAITGWHLYDPAFLKKYTSYDVHVQMIRSENVFVDNGKPSKYISRFVSNLRIVDCYVCVSEKVKRTMIEYTGINENRVTTIYNVIGVKNSSAVNSIPEEYKPYRDSTILATVCRLIEGPKGLIRMANVCNRLKKQGLNFKWFIIGDGPDRQLLIDSISKYEIQDTMILCGNKADPTPYYAYADLICVFSYMEGLCGVVNEAKILERPLIATRFTAIEEQIQHGVNGYIVENNEDSIYEGLLYLIKHPNYMKSLAINGLPQRLKDNELKIKEFEQLYSNFLSQRNR